MNSLHIAPEALRDLEGIKEYISEELDNPKAAINQINKITNRIRILKKHAYAGAALSSVADVESDYRFLVSNNYLIFYRLSGKAIYVDRILYGRRDYLRTLFKDYLDK